MKLSSSSLTGITEKPSLIEDIDFLVGTTSDDYPNADKLRNINQHYYEVVTKILSAQSNWEWDDTNFSTFPVGTTTLVDSQEDYTLPSGIVKLLRVEVLDSSGNYVKLKQVDDQEIPNAMTEFQGTAGMPLYYQEIGPSVKLFPAPASGSVTLAAGLKVYFQRNPTIFTNADAASSPGFDAQFHRILSLGAALDWAIKKGLPSVKALAEKKADLESRLMEHYAKRNREVRPKIRAPHINYA